MDGESATTSEQMSTSQAGAASPRAAAQMPAAPATKARRFNFGVLRHKHYRNVWLGAFGSSMGGWMELVGVQWLVTEGSTDPAMVLSLVAAAHLGPTMVLGLHGGLVADRVNRRTLALVTQGVMMVIAFALAACSFLGVAKPSVLIGLALLNGIAMAYNMPAWQVLTPRLVPKEELTEAMVLNGLQFNVARALGPGLAGFLMAAWSPTALFVLNAISFVGVMIAVWTTPDAPPPPRPTTSPWQQILEAFRWVWHERGPRAAFLGLVVFSLLGTPILRLLPAFVREVYQREEAVYGTLLSVMGVVAVLGVFLLRVVPRWYPKHHFIPVSFLGAGIASVLFAAASNPLWAGAALLLVGTFWLWSFNSAFAALQTLVDDRMRGRALAVSNVAVFGVMAVGPAVAGVIAGGAELVQPQITHGQGIQIGVAIMGAALVIASFVMLRWRTPEIDGLKPGDPGYDRVPGLVRGFTASGHRPPLRPRCSLCDAELPRPGAVCTECGAADGLRIGGTRGGK